MRLGVVLLIAGIIGGCASAEADGPDAGTSEPDDPPEIKPDATPRPDRPDAGPNQGSPDAGPGQDICAAALQMPDNDLCANAIDLTADAISAGGATVFGNTTGYTNAIEPDVSCTDPFGQDGPDAIYKVSATAGQVLSATMLPQDFDGSILLLASCTDLTQCVGADTALTSEQEQVAADILTSQEFFIVVDSYQPEQAGCFTLGVTLE